MTDRRRSSCWILPLLVSALALSTAAREPRRPDPAEGEVDGRRAVAFVATAPGESGRSLPPEGYRVHLRSTAEPTAEHVYPTGAWFAPRRGTYQAWIEGEDAISPAFHALTYRGRPFRGQGLVLEGPVHPAGRVALARGPEPAPGSVLRLLHLESHNRLEAPQPAMVREVMGERRTTGVLMPEGEILAALYDPEGDELLGLTRPVEVTRSRTVRVEPRLPEPGHTHVVAVLERPEPVARFEDYDVEPSLVVAGEAFEPDVLVPAGEHLHAVFYGVEGRYGTLRVASDRVFLEPVEIPLRGGRIESVTAPLRRLPHLEVRLELPDALGSAPITVRLEAGSERRVVGERTLEPTATRSRFDRLPRQRIAVRLMVGPWQLYEIADLRDGAPATVTFAPEPIYLHGTVYRGEEEHPARITFGAAGSEALEAVTDDEGRYEMTLFVPIHRIWVRLDGIGGPPYLELLDFPLRTSRRLDLHVPANRYRVRVVDATTGEGIAGAGVGSRNETEDGKTIQQQATADEDGWADLQPLRPGTVEVIAWAQGYRTTPEPIDRPIPQGAEGEEILVPLEPERPGARVRILLPDGIPAAGAEVQARRSLTRARPSWFGAADEGGMVTLPERVAGDHLLIRHPRAGFELARVPEEAGEGPVTLLLPPAAPLAVETVDGQGEAAPWAVIVLLVDGHRLYGPTLAWLTETQGVSDHQGFWGTRRTPAEPLSALAWSRYGSEAGRAGTFDPLAVPVHPPLEGPLRLEAHR